MKKPDSEIGEPDGQDDGRVIASMNVDGMPWYSPGAAVSSETDSSAAHSGNGLDIPVKMTKRETMAYMSGVLKASLLIALIFIGGLYLFIIFCINVWFR